MCGPGSPQESVLLMPDGEFMLVISDFQGVILLIFFWMRRYEQSSTMAATTKNLFARWLRIDHSPRKSTKKTIGCGDTWRIT
eukprot:symbB.v1.2.005372.t1/scaffold315.1/size251361/1